MRAIKFTLGPDFGLAAQRICARCVREPALRLQVEAQERAACSYCGQDGPTISIGELARRFERVLEHHFVCTDPDPSEREFELMMDSGRSYRWRPKGEPLVQVISATAQIDGQAAEHIRCILHERYTRGHRCSPGASSPYEADAMYVRKEQSEYKLNRAWKFLGRSVEESPYFNSDVQKLLDAAFENLEQRQTSGGEPVIATMGFGETIFRARSFVSDAALQAALARPEAELGPPPRASAQHSRMSGRGISAFYGARSVETAIAESRPVVGAKVAVGCFRVMRRLRLLDVDALRLIVFEGGSLFDDAYLANLERVHLLGQIAEHLSRPVTAGGAFEYYISQVIGDYLNNRRDLNLDGVTYRSTQLCGRGTNIMLFGAASRVAPCTLPKGAEVVVRMRGPSGTDPQYGIWQRLPPREPFSLLNEDDEERGPFSDLFQKEPVEEDSRRFTLWLDEDSISVHHVQAVDFHTVAFPVSRKQIQRLGGESEGPHDLW